MHLSGYKSGLCAILVLGAMLSACGGGGSGAGNTGSTGGTGNNGGTVDPPPAAWLVFTADKEVVGRSELYSTLSDNSVDPVNLSASSIPMQVVQFYVSPDGRWVAFLARGDLDGNGVFDPADGPNELFWVPVDGSQAAVKISGDLPGHADVGYVEWAPDSSRLVFVSDIDTDDVEEVYMVSMGNPNPEKINGPVGDAVKMGQARWSPDSRYVAQIVRNRTNTYIHDQVAINVHDVTLGTFNSTRMTGPTLPGSTWTGGVGTGANIESTVVWAPDSSSLAYMVEDNDDNTRFHYRAFPDGSNQRITRPLDSDERVGSALVWSTDSRYLAYTVRTIGGSDKLEVFDTSANASHRVVTGPGSAFHSRSDTLRWRPNSNDLALAAATTVGAPPELYILSGDSTHASLPEPVSANGNGKDLRDFVWSSDGRYFAYTVANYAEDTAELITIDADNENALDIVSHAGAPRVDYPGFTWASDNRLLYSFADGIYVASAGQGNSGSKINGELDVNMGTNFPSSFTVNPHNTEPAEQRAAFLAYRDGTDVVSAFTVLLDGSDRIDFAGDLIDGGGVKRVRFAADEE